MIWVGPALGAAWGVLAFVVVVAIAQRRGLPVRARALRGETAAGDRFARPIMLARRLLRNVRAPVASHALDAVAAARRARRSATDARILEREIPVVVDLLTVCSASGLTPYLAVEHTARWAPPGFREVFTEALRRSHLGMAFDESLRTVAEDRPGSRPVLDVMRESSRTGDRIVDALDRLATSARADIRRRAETRARSLSVRLLFPLVFLILPAFGLLVVVPTMIRGFSSLGS